MAKKVEFQCDVAV